MQVPATNKLKAREWAADRLILAPIFPKWGQQDLSPV